jgi:cytochrome c oxidase assembly factor CtaG
MAPVRPTGSAERRWGWEMDVGGRRKRPTAVAIPRAEEPTVAFALWIAAFFATGMAFVFDALRQNGLAVLSVGVAFAWLLPLLLPRSPDRR